MEKQLKTVGNVYQTKDYSIFKTMAGNRSVTEKRVVDVKKSVKEVGMLPIPIVVNENYEIIDGQARFEFCKRNNLDVTFYKVDGLGQKECTALNAYGSKWSLMDYVNSYAELGNENYIRLLEFSSHHPKYSIRLLFYLLGKTSSAHRSNAIKDGTLQIPAENVVEGEKISEFLEQFATVRTNRKDSLYMALIACYKIDEIDNAKLARKILDRPRDFETIASVRECIQVIEEVYNIKAKQHVYIETLYLQSLEKKLGDKVSIEKWSDHYHES